MRGRKPRNLTPTPDNQPALKPESASEHRKKLSDRLVATVDMIHAMTNQLRREGGNEALLQRAEFYFECAFLAAGWSLDYTDENDKIHFIL